MISVRSVRFRLLAAVNTAIVVLLGIFLVLDYRREIAERVAEKHVALAEEAKTLLPAVIRIRPYGEAAVQRYIDDVCGRMWDALSPGHHIAVRLNETVLQAVAHHRASPEILEAMKVAARSSTHRAEFGNEELVVGSSQQADTAVYVSEYLSSIRQAARTQVLRRLPRIVLLAVITAIVVNVVFLRMAARPLRQLVDTVRRIAKGELGVRVGPFKSGEFDYLADAINSMSSSLAETESRRRLEMAKARNIQEQLLPDQVRVARLRFAHLYQPAEDVAGDYYDMIPLRNGACLACIADVTGHGVPAALSAAMLKAYLQDASEHHSDPGEILRFLNYRLAVISQTDNFVTMCVVVVDSDRKTLRYASAGHESGLLLTADGRVTELPSTGLVLGIIEEADWTTETLAVSPGDRLLLATDGVTEAMSQEGELFGRERLACTFKTGRDVTIQESVDRIGCSLDEHCDSRAQSDDITLLAFEVLGESPDEQGNGQRA
ncbi:MAG: PP2C family protein-serine/threonine phosphatase [Planctomycetota bacterium]|jgi:serine phosphatase RsbU (regulator of sigma subunit)